MSLEPLSKGFVKVTGSFERRMLQTDKMTNEK